MLKQFALSRFLARLERSDHTERFILKGAHLFRFIDEEGHRPTRDTDFLSFDENDHSALKEIFTRICQLPSPEDDALTWENIRAAAIRDENSYGGLRVLVTSRLGHIRIPLRFDIGFGDIITDISHFLLPILMRQVSDLLWAPSEHWQARIEAGFE